MTAFLGLKIVSQPLAVERRTEFKVEPHGTRRKRRKAWRVVRVDIERPAAFKTGDTVYMHPDLIAKLPHTAAAGVW